MIVTISQEEKEVLNDLKESFIKLNSFILSLSWSLLLSIRGYISSYFVSLKEFAPSEIKKHGLEQILIRRALRFFGLEASEPINRRGKSKGMKNTYVGRGMKRIGIKLVKLVAFPFYVLILTILWFRTKKDVKNKYKT